jgi:UrcA family protein
MRSILIVAAAVAALASTSPATAGGHIWQVGNDSFNVHLSDLDLKTAAGRAQALARVEKAAGRLCRTQKLQSDRAACEADTVAAASRGPAGATLRMALAERANQAWAVAEAK